MEFLFIIVRERNETTQNNEPNTLLQDALASWKIDPNNESGCRVLDTRIMEERHAGNTIKIFTNGCSEPTEHILPPIARNAPLKQLRSVADPETGRLILYNTIDGTKNINEFSPSEVVSIIVHL
jgi:hypothetical protein